MTNLTEPLGWACFLGSLLYYRMARKAQREAPPKPEQTKPEEVEIRVRMHVVEESGQIHSVGIERVESDTKWERRTR